MVGGLEKVLLAVLLLVLMTGMGATLRTSDFGAIATNPRGALIGLCSQFGWMPAIAYGLSIVFQLPTELALGLVIVGATPGGTTSNMFTYFARGDLALSISMTVVSTVVAVVAMPLVLMAYASPLGAGELGIPYANIVTTLALVLVPVAIGMAIRSRSATAARWTERLGAVSGALVLAVLVVSSVVRNAAVFSEIPVGGYAAAVLLGLLGMGLGYLSASLARLTHSQRRAVSLETGIQNSPLAFGIILGSFAADLHDAMLRLPMLYALFVLLTASGASLLFRGLSANETTEASDATP